MLDDRKRKLKVPTIEDAGGTCRRCGAYAEFKFDVGERPGFDLSPPQTHDERFLVCVCQACQQQSLVVQSYERSPRERSRLEWRVVAMWPTARVKVPSYLPSEIKGLYREAAQCLAAGCFRASVVMTRAGLDAALIDKGASGKTLYDRIRSMKDELRPMLIEIFGRLKDSGNDAAHDFDEEWSREEASGLFAFLEEVARELYETPGRLERLRELAENRGKID